MKPNDEWLPTSWTLVNALKDGKKESWERFDRIYRPLLENVARKHFGLSPEEAQDARQEAMASLFKHLPRFQADSSKGSFHGWLLKILRSKSLDLVRKRPPRAVGSDAPDGTSATPLSEQVPDETDVDLVALLDEGWQAYLLGVALDEVRKKVSSTQYQVLYLSLKEGKTPKDIAAMMGRAQALVYLDKTRGLAALKKIVKRLQDRLPESEMQQHVTHVTE